MRLLNTSTLQVKEFLQSKVPDYVILSHTWEEEEVTLQDIQSGAATSKKGYGKITSCCRKAAEDGYTYCWIDTCCIDKTSSAELSESINSMYQWYKNARICYAYIADFNVDCGISTSTSTMKQVARLGPQRWFTRGWTLQELIAPTVVEFYDTNWNEFGTRLSLQDQLAHITGISKFILQGGDLANCEIAVRMSWAAKRKTTRIEDEAYCLLGLFGVNMPLLYGEGSRAFRRLQEEIMRVDEDYTLFAWSPRESVGPGTLISRGLLAHAPSDFAEFKVETPDQSPLMSQLWVAEDLGRDNFSLFPPSIDYLPPYLTSRGLRITLPIMLTRSPKEFYACLTVIYPVGMGTYLLCIKLYRPFANYSNCVRLAGAPLAVLPRKDSDCFEYTTMYIEQPAFHSGVGALPWEPEIRDDALASLLLIVKSQADFSWRFTCNSIPLVNTDRIIQARFRSQTATSAIVSPKTTRRPANESTYDLVNLTQKQMDQICPGHSTKLFLPRGDATDDVFRFAFDGQPQAAFDVQVDLQRSSATCEARLCNSSKYRQSNEGTNSSLGVLSKTDRVTLHLELQHDNIGQGQGNMLSVEATVSIRRVAARLKAQLMHFGAKRYELSIDLKNISA